MIALFKRKTNPTIDKYFLDPLSQRVSLFPWPTKHRSIVRLGPNTFSCQRRVVIVRYITDRELSKIKNLNPERIFYLLDDDFSCVKNDDSLPSDYRARMAKFAADYLPQIRALADEVIAPNEQVLRVYGDKHCQILQPSYTALCQNFSHFNQPRQIKIVFLGSRSHVQDLNFLTDMLLRLCRQYQHVTVTTFFGQHAPKTLQGIANIKHRSPMAWPGFKQLLHQERFHIALAPSLDTDFNRGRSFNKVLDHAAVGAAGLYSETSSAGAVVQPDVNGLLIKNEPSAWFEVVERLIVNLEIAKRLAEQGAVLSESIGNPKRVRHFWKARLLF